MKTLETNQSQAPSEQITKEQIDLLCAYAIILATGLGMRFAFENPENQVGYLLATLFLVDPSLLVVREVIKQKIK